jgi:hypothetical protein
MRNDTKYKFVKIRKVKIGETPITLVFPCMAFFKDLYHFVGRNYGHLKHCELKVNL